MSETTGGGEPPPPRIVLHVGCGFPAPQKLHAKFRGPEWREVRLDIDPGVAPDIVSSTTDMRAVPTDSVEAVWSSHNLEHLYRHEAPLALREFLRVLKPGGEALLTMPDLQSVAECVVANQLEDEAYLSAAGPISALDMLYGHGASLARGNLYMAHKCGFTAKTLGALMREAGFEEIEVRRGGSFDLWAAARKPAP